MKSHPNLTGAFLPPGTSETNRAAVRLPRRIAKIPFPRNQSDPDLHQSPRRDTFPAVDVLVNCPPTQVKVLSSSCSACARLTACHRVHAEISKIPPRGKIPCASPRAGRHGRPAPHAHIPARAGECWVGLRHARTFPPGRVLSRHRASRYEGASRWQHRREEGSVSRRH